MKFLLALFWCGAFCCKRKLFESWMNLSLRSLLMETRITVLKAMMSVQRQQLGTLDLWRLVFVLVFGALGPLADIWSNKSQHRVGSLDKSPYHCPGSGQDVRTGPWCPKFGVSESQVRLLGGVTCWVLPRRLCSREAQLFCTCTRPNQLYLCDVQLFLLHLFSQRRSNCKRKLFGICFHKDVLIAKGNCF